MLLTHSFHTISYTCTCTCLFQIKTFSIQIVITTNFLLVTIYHYLLVPQERLLRAWQFYSACQASLVFCKTHRHSRTFHQLPHWRWMFHSRWDSAITISNTNWYKCICICICNQNERILPDKHKFMTTFWNVQHVCICNDKLHLNFGCFVKNNLHTYFLTPLLHNICLNWYI